MRFMEKYGGNVAGFFWNAGTALQFVFGLIAQSPREIASAIFNILSPCSYLFFGHTNRGVIAGGIFGSIGTAFAVYPGIVNGEIGTIFGLIVFCCLVSLSIFSVSLTQKFAHTSNSFLRLTLGHPRRLNGLGSFFLSRLPIIFENITHDR